MQNTVFIKERVTKIDVIQVHKRGYGISVILNGICQFNLVFENRDTDLPLQYKLLLEDARCVDCCMNVYIFFVDCVVDVFGRRVSNVSMETKWLALIYGRRTNSSKAAGRKKPRCEAFEKT